MTGDVIIGVDAGTSVIKAVAFDLSGRQVASESRRNTYQPVPGGGVEQNMARTWTDTAAVLSALVAKLKPIQAAPVALAVTGQGDGTWLIDAAGKPVGDAWLWLDARAVAEARALEASAGIDLIYKATGTGVNVCQMRTHLNHMKAHTPHRLKEAATAFHCKDWLYFNLTGVRATDPTEGVFTFGNMATRDYDEDVIAALGLSGERSLMPPIVDGAVTAHGLTPEAASATELPSGLPVMLGYVDVMCSSMGAGLHDSESKPGLTLLGSTGMHMRFVDDASAVVLNEDRGGYTMAFPGNAFAQIQTNMAATLNIDWVVEMARAVLQTADVERDHGAILADLDGPVLDAKPGAAMFHPYISSAGERGPFAEPDARASFTGLDQNTGWFDMVRAVYDGLALAARDCYAAMGPVPGEIRLSGGAARSKAIRTILAASLGAPVRTVNQAESGAAGAAMIAAVQLGIHR
ncbi:MAG: FGGY-family carbohydrate kinase, partial [Pseudomonadota bacterium]